MDYRDHIGVFDSGVGGISILQGLRKTLPAESFLYFGDSANAPYGEKTPDEVLRLSEAIAERMIGQGVKAIVIACNTATSAAAATLRKQHPDLPIIGVEPAIKPAAEAFPDGKILVLATEVTLKLEKFRRLSHRLEGRADFVPVSCIGLAERIEKGRLDSPDLIEMLHHLLDEYAGGADALVLGCTHYPFIKRQLRSVLGDLPMFDSTAGTARELKRVLEKRKLLREGAEGVPGEVVLRSSRDTAAELQLYRQMLESVIE